MISIWDDIILYIENMKESTKELLELMNKFSQVLATRSRHKNQYIVGIYESLYSTIPLQLPIQK